ncbi:NAD-dependent epimerase/dehydratase family protein [Caenimonas sedimenti]|uniref:NAD-dependent epimerase/dehydratase family protein n=1 Tax=Caenimonas sedimenti TaxID=2596921 RepID=A0A562ZVE5_9BURK|nr:GDP-mannose 4,6-dehydratase [Caenimonas sedimenti]TWO72298.1 NAD-dependent epimerase/dehydratase family protein [Caenimonas sedimenti]
MKLLITGGCGFLGSNLAAHAIERGDELVIFDSLYRKGSIDNLRWLQSLGEFRHVHGDVRSANDVRRVVTESLPDAVFHLAGQVAMTTSIANSRYDFEVNAFGTFNVLEAVRDAAPAAAIVYSSTNKVYGDLEQYEYQETATRYECTDRPQGFDEETCLDFHSPYGCSKGAADQYMLDFARIFGLRTIVFRHSSMYGGRQFASADQGWVGWFCQKAAEVAGGVSSQPFTISGSGKQVRDVLHARDMVSLYFKAIEHMDIAKGQAFNIGGGIDKSLSLLELFSLLEGFIGKPLQYEKLPPRESDQRVFVADISKARRMLGWSPVVTPSDGVRQMLEWVVLNDSPRH